MIPTDSRRAGGPPGPESADGPPGPESGGDTPALGRMISDALRYWERRRLVYNLVLVAVVLGHFFALWPASLSALGRERLLDLFVLTVVANVFYCSAYAVDLFVQLSGFRAAWVRRRWLLLLIGTAFASVLAHFMTMDALTRRVGG